MAKKDDKQEPQAEPAIESPEVATPTPAIEAEPVVESSDIEKAQAALDKAASLRVLLKNAGPALDKIVAGWKLVLEGVEACEVARLVQVEAAKQARSSAEANNLPVYATEFGHNAMAAKCWDLIATLPTPAVDFPTAYVRQFGNEHERLVSTQVALNSGTTLVAPGYSAQEIHDALLAGVRASDIQSGRVSLEQLKFEAQSR